MDNEYNIGLVKLWDEEEMGFYQADLVFSLKKLRSADYSGNFSLKYYIRFKLYDENGTYIGGRFEFTNDIRFTVVDDASGGYFCDLNEYCIICTKHQIKIINDFIANGYNK